MALGSGMLDRSRKRDLIMHIRIKRNIKGMSIDEAIESTKGYNRKTVAELETILKDEN